jgi:anti-sigma B factor antagonist
MSRASLLNELRHEKAQFARLVYRFQESRAQCAVLCADLLRSGRVRAPAGLPMEPLTLPLYAFTRSPHGVLRLVPQPHIGGGNGTTPLHCWVEPIAEAVVVHVEGEVDLSTAPWFAETIAYAFRQNRSVIVDLSAVSYLDGSGIAVLKRAAESHLAHIAVSGSPPQIRRLFDIVQLSDVIPFVASLEAGRAYLRERD